jgi:hypothetical protein
MARSCHRMVTRISHSGCCPRPASDRPVTPHLTLKPPACDSATTLEQWLRQADGWIHGQAVGNCPRTGGTCDRLGCTRYVPWLGGRDVRCVETPYPVRLPCPEIPLLSCLLYDSILVRASCPVSRPCPFRLPRPALSANPVLGLPCPALPCPALPCPLSLPWEGAPHHVCLADIISTANNISTACAGGRAAGVPWDAP